MGRREIVIDYSPRAVFWPYHQRTQRWACIVAHRRCGKTVACINDQVRRAIMLAKPHGRLAYVAPYLAQAKEVAWDYLRRYAAPITKDKNEGELWIELLNGARIRIHGADNPDRLRGSYLDDVIMDEYADMRPSVWGEVIRPMLADREGTATFIGTPKGRNEFHAVAERAKADPERWFFAMLKASTTGILSQSEIEEMCRDMTPEQVEQELECSFDAAILGAYFGREIAEAERAGRITDVPYDPKLPVHTAWDLGKGANMAIWFFQIAYNEVRIIDHEEGSHNDGITQLVDVLNGKGYRYGNDYVPHDAKVAEISTGRTRIETMVKLRRCPALVADHKVDDGIAAARLSLAHCWFDRAKCANGLEALRQYRADYDEKTKAFKNIPKHDWTSHSADAFRYLAMAWRAIAKPTPPKPPEPMRGIGQITVDEFLRNVQPRKLRV
jgi:hypothetical protein